MKWKEITIYTTEEGTEIILARLDMLGITQVNIVQGDEEIDALLDLKTLSSIIYAQNLAMPAGYIDDRPSEYRATR